MSQANPETAKSESANLRWWEFYAVRYGMGSVVGAVVLYFLCITNPVFKSLFFGVEVTEMDAAKLTMLLACGLTYCYVASGPILVLHATRFLLELDSRKKATCAAWVVRGIVLLLILLTVGSYAFLTNETGVARVFYSLIVAVGALIIWAQYGLIYWAQAKNNQLYLFYKKLAQKRDANKSSLTESYKHLREHGNSFAIVFLEITLGLILFSFGNMEYWITERQSYDSSKYVLPYICIVFLWITPSVLVWQIATTIERRFADD